MKQIQKRAWQKKKVKQWEKNTKEMERKRNELQKTPCTVKWNEVDGFNYNNGASGVESKWNKAIERKKKKNTISEMDKASKEERRFCLCSLCIISPLVLVAQRLLHFWFHLYFFLLLVDSCVYLLFVFICYRCHDSSRNIAI